jgi:protein-arginine kinase activator protein McsA
MNKLDPEAATMLLYIQDSQERLEWCVETERYELAARIRDRIIYDTTDNEEWKKQYMAKLKQKYTNE